jgi:hypothetical protein
MLQCNIRQGWAGKEEKRLQTLRGQSILPVRRTSYKEPRGSSSVGVGIGMVRASGVDVLRQAMGVFVSSKGRDYSLKSALKPLGPLQTETNYDEQLGCNQLG